MLVHCLTLPTTRPEEFSTKTPSPVTSSIDLFTPPPRPPSDGHFTPQPEKTDYPANEGWRWREDIQAWANCHHVLSPMGFKRQSKFYFSSLTHFTSRNHNDFSPLCIEQNQLNLPQQDSPVSSLPRKQTLRQPTPGPSGTQWSEDLFRSKKPKFHLISIFDSSELTLPPFVEPSQTNEPPIPGPIPSSKPHEDVLTCDPEHEVAPTQSMEEPFGKSQLHFFYSSQLFLSFPLTISSSSHSTRLHHHQQQYTRQIPPPLSPSLCFSPPSTPTPVPPRTPLPPHSHNEAHQEITDLQLTLMIP
ncbi:hypothetical protein O181_054491 [Austropuccinia psidii MF-1]|uniref:Uncharacterized protein n=1 Tax=Austropuccinia psidii MF-1 TaxID=1389203 RepID=A0A9Q3E9J8_9BASI|nr:hypothetical protein [Austropuccinia psidii MF-1]